MKRDLDLVRSILIYVEKADDEVDAEGFDGSPHALAEYVETDVGSHREYELALFMDEQRRRI